MTDWRRDARPTIECTCGHQEQSHDIRSTQRRGACSRYGCDCRELTPAFRVWAEHRTVREPIEEAS